MEQSPVDADDRVFEMINGYRLAQAVRFMSRLEIADILADGSMTVDQLATECRAHPRSLRLLMRVLVAQGLLSTVDGSSYCLTELGMRLRGDSPGRMCAWAVLLCEEQYEAWSAGLHTIRTGRPGFDRVFGMKFWRFLADHPAKANEFDSMMSDDARRWSCDIGINYDFGPVATVIDVGGGTGLALTSILDTNPHLNGILYELPTAASTASKHLASASCANRMEVLAGDFLDSVPEGGDVYLLCRVLSDWDDEGAGRILRNCRRRMGPSARLLIVTQLPDTDSSLAKAIVDLHLLILLGGVGRSASDYANLLHDNGFSLDRSVPLDGGLTLLEAAPSPVPRPPRAQSCGSASDALATHIIG